MTPVSKLIGTLDVQNKDGWHTITLADAPLIDNLHTRFIQICQDMRDGISPIIKAQFTVENNGG